MKNELMPGFLDGSISGAAVGGPIGGGKTYICEAVAAELGVPIIILKNIRSMWYGETDQIFERTATALGIFPQGSHFRG
jgi:SpoVK/Ycf46/Vps4 family AAA+-type ATPase